MYKSDGIYFEEIILSLFEDFDEYIKATREQDVKEGWDALVNGVHVDVTLNFWNKKDVVLLYQEFMSSYILNVGYKIRRGKYILVLGFDFSTRDIDDCIDILWDRWEDEIFSLVSSALQCSENSVLLA